MRIIKIILFFCSLFYTFLSIAQNNAIFKGGVSDGWDNINHQQNSSNIFKGGISDGWNTFNYQQISSNIFKGGIADGWSSLNYIQQATNITKGGSGDGWNNVNHIQASTVIFSGGIGDGWDVMNYIQNSKGIYKGGLGDGWASNYLPMGPIPVTFLFFNAGKKGEGEAILHWKTSQEVHSWYYDVERSSDAINFAFIGKVSAAGESQLPVEYYFTDQQPMKGMNYYRLKQVDMDGHYKYTVSRLVRFSDILESNIKYFPNPTNGLLNIELPSSIDNESKVINISDATGIVLNQFKLDQTTNRKLLIDLSAFPKGVYYIQVRSISVNSTHRIVLQ